MQERMEQRGALRLTLTDKNGSVVLDKKYKNRIVAKGRELVARLFTNSSSDGFKLGPLSHIELGEGPKEVGDGDTGLVTSRAGTRKPVNGQNNMLTCVDVTENDIKRTMVKVTAVYDYKEANGDKPLCEAGLFNGDVSDSNAVMYNRVIFDPVYKKEEFKLTLQWEIIF